MKKGTIVSRTLAEAGLKPEEGMKISYSIYVCTISKTYKDGDVRITQENTGDYIVKPYQLKTILVEYEEPAHASIYSAHDDIHFRGFKKKYLPLNTSQWQQAIDAGLVDSGKEVEFKQVANEIEDGYNFPFLTYTATLIPQQDDMETLVEKAIPDHPYPDMTYPATAVTYIQRKTWIAGYKAAQQKMYSEEEVLNKLRDFVNDSDSVFTHLDLDEWWNKNKKQ